MNKRSGMETRERIIHAAMSVFSRHGYAKANIRDIARTAGISVGGVYLYFKNKEELYKSIIKEGMLDFGGKIETITAKAKSATGALSDFLKLHFENALRHKEFILLHFREHGFTFAMDEKKQFFRRQQKLIEKIILSGIRSGEFRRCNAKEMSNIIMGTLRGTIVSIAIDGDVIVTSKGLSEFILKGLLKVSKVRCGAAI